VNASESPAAAVQIRDAVPEDWPAMWSFMRPIVRAGEMYIMHRRL